MKGTIITIIVFIVWLVLTVVIGNLAKSIVMASGANHITFSDISACYIVTGLILGVLIFIISLIVIQKL